MSNLKPVQKLYQIYRPVPELNSRKYLTDLDPAPYNSKYMLAFNEKDLN